MTRLSAYRLLPDRAPPSTSVRLPLAAADPAKTLRAGNELDDQGRQPDPDDYRSGKTRCEGGDTAPFASHEQRSPNGERALDDDEAQQICVKRRSFRAGNGFAERIAVEEPGSDEKRGPQRNRQRASARNQKTGKQHRDCNEDLGTGKIDAVHVQRDADRRGNDEQRRQYEIEPADAHGYADRQQEGEVIRSDDRMTETGEEPINECRGGLTA